MHLFFQMATRGFLYCAAFRRHRFFLSLSLARRATCLRIFRRMLDLRAIAANFCLFRTRVRIHQSSRRDYARSFWMPDFCESCPPGCVRARPAKCRFARALGARSQIIFRLIADQLARVGQVQTFEAVVAQAIEDRELDMLCLDALPDELGEIAPRNVSIEETHLIFVLGRFSRLERADA